VSSIIAPETVPRGGPTGGASSLAGGAFWRMVERVVVLAASVDVLFFVLFHVLGSPLLAWLNVVSVALYAAAYLMLRRRINRPAIALIWVEVLGHAGIGTWLVGWDSGFHYYLLMFIPAIVISTSPRLAAVLVGALLAFYLGLDAMSRAVGPLTPLQPTGLVAVKWFNIVVVFMMFSALGRFYVGLVRRAEWHLKRMATSDPLTGLFNRRHFQAMAEHTVAHARRADEPVALILADVDHFKQVNDAHGHDVGDKMLVHAVGVLQRVRRDQDILARWGGEEFLILLPDTGPDGAAVAAERMREAVQASALAHGDELIRCTMSFGVTGVHRGEPLSDAVARADRAMYRSKEAGRNRVSGE